MKRNFAFATLTSLFVALSAHAAVYDLKLLFDTDRHPSTGCSVTVSSITFTGVEQVINTRVDVTSGVATTLGVTRQACVGGTLASAVPSDTQSWSAGLTPAGNLFVETHVTPAEIGMTTLTPMRMAIIVTNGTLTDGVDHSGGGRPSVPGTGTTPRGHTPSFDAPDHA
jgi:hypothetical protein